jgi:serine/threonine-protein kinase
MSSDNAPAFFGRYQVLEELGAGAMGVVYLCVDPRLARPVAIKVLKESEFMSPAEREQFRARFRHEAEAAGRLNHPGIVQIYDIGPSYLVMEFLEGRPLSALLRSGAALKVRQITNLVQRMADAVDYAHRNGIVHRDIKPANVMIMDDGGVKVMDFGVARLDTSNLTAVGTVVGSVRYMAPEQMMGQRVDGRADVFSLAAVAYELLTGCPPFPGKTITEVVSRVVHGSHIPPREADRRLPEALNEVFAKAFAPRLESRYAHALDFARELLAAIKPVADLEIEHVGEEGARTRVEIHAPTLKGGAARQPDRPAADGETVVMAAPAASHTGGVLMLECDPPGAHVFVDGKPVGQAPLHAVDVSFGRHLVRMEAPARQPAALPVDVKTPPPVW